MGTEISLEIAGLSVDWCKNDRGTDHGAIFQECDRQRFRSDQINYDYFAENDDGLDRMEAAFVRSLKDIVPRIELLGFTLDAVRADYDRVVQDWLQERDEEEVKSEVMSFDEFLAFATEHAVRTLDDAFIGSSGDEIRMRGRFASSNAARRLPHSYSYEWSAYSERSYFGGLIGFLHPYSLLRVLASNSENLAAQVVWQYGPLVEAGWAQEGQFRPEARRTQTFLIATEGSSDAHILGHALALLRPEIADFFRFIDVAERHPFPGTGNLLKFAEGLVKIDVQNQMLFLFDNDAEGFEAFQKLSEFRLPANMRGMILPTLDQFRSFSCRGPAGAHIADINRRAAAIECYLDLTFARTSSTDVVWTSYKRESDAYQGALDQKEVHAKAFLKQTRDSLAECGYDLTKLNAVLDAMVANCTMIAVNGANRNLE